MAFIIAAVIIALIIIWAIASYNSLVKLRNKGDEAESAIDAHLKERADLIPNLVETVKGYASHEAHLFAVAESYPDLKANQNFLDLQRQLSRIEEELRNARKYFNAIVREYNDKIMVFPSSLIAAAFHFTKRDYYEVDDEDRKRVEVRF